MQWLAPLVPLGWSKHESARQDGRPTLHIGGDELSECGINLVPMAPRVAIVANTKANLAIELLVNMKSSGGR